MNLLLTRTAGSIAALVVALAGCASNDHPVADTPTSAATPASASPTTSTRYPVTTKSIIADTPTSAATPASASPTTSTRYPVTTKSIIADTLTIGATGVRCFVGNISLACAASIRPMKVGDSRLWTVTESNVTPVALEPGFQPGQAVDPTGLVVGDNTLTITSPNGARDIIT